MRADPPPDHERWLEYSAQDLSVAARELNSDPAIPRIVCSLAQQGAEKALKAGLVFCALEPPRSHNLDALRNLLPEEWGVHSKHPDLASLTFWSIESRYPSDFEEPTAAQARDALASARALLNDIREDILRASAPPR